MFYHITQESSNEKTGKMLVTTSAQKTCPPSCPLFGKCYACGGPLKMHWDKVSRGERGDTFPAFARKLRNGLGQLPARSLWRHNQAGDLPGTGDRINRAQALKLARLNQAAGMRGYTYTHKPVLGAANKANRQTVRQMNRLGFTVNLSANSLQHADKLAQTGLPVAAILPADTIATKLATPQGRTVVVCPAQTGSKTCQECGLCAVADARRPIIGFLAHGSRKGIADKIARGV